MPITLAGIGEEVTITRIGGNEETKHHLADLGFVIGSKVTVISSLNGNLILNVKESRIAINKDMARYIMF
jgi:ferrous iron transport protein A